MDFPDPQAHLDLVERMEAVEPKERQDSQDLRDSRDLLGQRDQVDPTVHEETPVHRESQANAEHQVQQGPQDLLGLLERGDLRECQATPEVTVLLVAVEALESVDQ